MVPVLYAQARREAGKRTFPAKELLQSLTASFHVLLLARLSPVTLAKQNVLAALTAVPREIAKQWIYVLLQEALALDSSNAGGSTFWTIDLRDLLNALY